MPRRSETMGSDSCGCGVKIWYDEEGYVERVEVTRHCQHDTI